METVSVRTITEIIDVETGELLHIDDYFFRQNEAYLFLLRRRLYEYAYLQIGQPKYVCAVCGQPVVLLGKKTKRGQVAYFAHYKDSDDCPIKTHSGEMSEEDIKRCTYIGETERHIEIKHQISSALETSHINNMPFSHIQEEERIASKLDFRSWAVPDVYAECGDLKINFEVQLSTIFLSTIIERDVYYRFHGIFLIWVFAPGAVNEGTISMKDIVWTNNGNMFIYDQIAHQLTQQTGELTLLCRWYEWMEGDMDAVRLVGGKYVSLSNLTFDRKANTVYYVDVASRVEECCPGYKKDRREMEQMELEALDEFRVKLDGATPTKEEVVEGIKSGLHKPRWVKKGNHYGYAKYGHTIIPFIYTHAEEFVDNVAIVRRDRRYGLVDVFGEEIVKPIYNDCCQFHEGLAAIKLNGRWGFINANGEAITSITYNDCRQFHEGFAAIKLNGRWGFINAKGETITSITYNDCRQFSNGLAAVKRYHKWGFIDTEGKEVISPQYYKIVQDFKDGYAIVKNRHSGGQIYIDRQGRAYVKDGDKLIAVPAIYDDYRTFSEGLLAVSLNNKWGFIDMYGKEIIPIRYDDCCDFCEGFARVAILPNKKRYYHKNDLLWGVVNSNGVEIVTPQYSYVGEFHRGYAIVSTQLVRLCRNEKFWGVIDTNGKKIINTLYEACHYFSEGLAAVKQGGKWGFFDTNGKEVIPTQYDEVVEDFKEGFAIVKTHFGKNNIRIDRRGQVVVKNGDTDILLPTIYDEYRDFSEGLAAVRRGCKWGFIDINGVEVIVPEYEGCTNFHKGISSVVINRKVGCIDTRGNVIVAPRYDVIYKFNDGKAWVANEIRKRPNGQIWMLGIVDCQGYEILPPIYNGDNDFVAEGSNNTYCSVWDFYIKARQPIRTKIDVIKENGYECHHFEFLGLTFNKVLFIPKYLTNKSLDEGDEIDIYIVKYAGCNKSVIASPHLQIAHFDIDEKWHGEVVRIEKYGVFVKLDNSQIISLAHHSTFDTNNALSNYKIGDIVNIKIISKDEYGKKINIRILSIVRT